MPHYVLRLKKEFGDKNTAYAHITNPGTILTSAEMFITAILDLDGYNTPESSVKIEANSRNLTQIKIDTQKELSEVTRKKLQEYFSIQ